ncbi:3D domain-containing protein [Priestia megaterium]|uniref:3D domain-containing protein n=1 Tax=Priestia megaterium TaxID=1404 RepID=UPI002FFD6429
MKTSSSGSGEQSNGRHLKVVATGYSLIGDSQGSDGDPLTATGTYPATGRTIAVDPNVIPLGSTVYIPALGGSFKAEDTGGAIDGNHIDVYMANGDIARQWGRKTLDIYVQ